ncbi:hypothetical protein [Bordetella flabilis]|uniref:Uncharacterized protein n=1 Tax=Bordetella flabilis TaxID=463014 RepID=A0A193GAE4_9BORD|nr:hypothetical protein [Bordetella flabilis]ANN76805.1 hypothetical protein BAU07_06470 [Bordetella flabilis]
MQIESNGNPQGTGDAIQDAAQHFDHLLSVEDGEQPGGEAQPANQGKGKPNPDTAELPDDDLEDVDLDDESDLDDSQGDDDEEDAGQSDEEGDGADKGQEQPKEFTVKVDGEDLKVTLDELLQGYSRTADYTRKTQVVAQERQAAQAEAEQARQERAKYATALQQANELIQKLTPQEPDWDALYQQDPNEWARQREVWRSWREQQQQVTVSQRELHAQAEAERQLQMKQHLQAERQKTLEALPEWKDDQRRAADQRLIVEYGRKLGYSDDELKQVFDHRVLLMARDAARYRQLQEKRATMRPNGQRPGRKPAQPGSANERTPRTTDTTRAKQRLAKTGAVKDAASVFEKLLPED